MSWVEKSLRKYAKKREKYRHYGTGADRDWERLVYDWAWSRSARQNVRLGHGDLGPERDVLLWARKKSPTVAKALQRGWKHGARNARSALRYEGQSERMIEEIKQMLEARSRRKPYAYHSTKVSPKRGKRRTSRKLRRKARQLAKAVKSGKQEYFLLDDPQDKKRGRAGSRSPDHGWKDFGDGRYYDPRDNRLRRK